MTESDPAGERLAGFRRDVAELKVTGGQSGPERMGARVGASVALAGVTLAACCWYGAVIADRFEQIQRLIIAGGIFVGVAVIGAIVWLRFSMSRYLRYWLIRLVYEEREQTAQLLGAQSHEIDRLIAALDGRGDERSDPVRG